MHIDALTPVLHVVGQLVRYDVAESQRVGMNQFFPKPIKIGQLTTLLQNWCAEAPGGADEPAAKRPCHG